MNRLLGLVALAATLIAGLCGLAGGYYFAKHQTTAHFLSVQNSDLRESQKETQRQIGNVLKARKDHHAQLAKIADFERRYRNADRLRVKAEHEAAIERASAGNLRAYAKGLHGLYSECREAYGDLAAEGARAASSAGAMK